MFVLIYFFISNWNYLIVFNYWKKSDLGIATHVLSYLQVTFWLIASQRQTILIRKKLFKSILKQEIGWFDVYKTGELNNRLTEYFCFKKLIFIIIFYIIFDFAFKRDVNKIREGVGDKCGNGWINNNNNLIPNS